MAQLIIKKRDANFIFEEVDEVDGTDRGAGAFGSTGK